MSGLGRRGFLPTCHTELARWAVENGYTAANIASRIGLGHTTIRRHFLGWGMHPTTSRLYRSHFPDCPVPIRGRPIFYANPLPIRHLPTNAAQPAPGSPPRPARPPISPTGT